MTRRVAVVPHTHWDREWYSPFQSLRLRLVDLLDDLLPRLEAEGSHFLLDGQLAAVDDYLEVRPEAEDPVRRLVASGRLSIGPWYVLPDEFCVSGETLVRNLELGLERADRLGGSMDIGYLPDMFGHVAQMPQLLRLAGFDHAVVWRGVPAAVDRTAFWWSAPDGSTVRAEYLATSYANGAAVPDDAKRLLDRVRAHEVELGPLLAPGAPLLWMNGADHQAPQPWLARVVDEVNAFQDYYQLVVTSLTRYLATAPTAGLPAWTGELRSSARANLLMGVLSNRVDVKQAAARAERALERRAEPLCALYLPPERWPAIALRLAWLGVVRNAAHDSSCACSADDVVDAVLHRYAEARQVAEGLADRALAALAASASVEGPLAVNLTARPRSGLVEVVVAGEPPAGSQTLTYREARSWDVTVAGADIVTVLGQVRNRALAVGAEICSIDVVDHDDGLDVAVRVAAPPRVDPTATSDLFDLYARAGARRHAPVRLRVQEEAFTRALMRVDDVPPFGWRAVEPGTVAPVRADGQAMENGRVRVEVDPDHGTFSIDDRSGVAVTGLDRLVDDGDAGDTYNWSPPATDAVVDRPESVTVEVAESGPLRAVLLVTRTFAWPERVVGGARSGSQRVDVHTRLELHAGERLVRVATSFDNRCRDHRVRSWFPLPEGASVSRAECAFGIVERGLTAEGGPQEAGVPTFPSRRFVCAGGLTVVHEGLLEYELVDGGRALALTLLRAVGLLSGTDLTTRPGPAGPPVPAEGAQMQGRREMRYGVVVGEPDPWGAVDDAFLPLELATGSGRGTLPPTGSALTVAGAQVSAVRRVGAQLELRVFNPTPGTTTVALPGRRGWLVDLRGRPQEPFDGSFPLRPWGIATVRLD
ncbi:MAG TPA: glycoside hydrolase family 38 C-terminal domain-containing protein [Acidimicrobiales bacterium]|nr:glycoside hydrolase family 38 C-terminal domain-containing protein [Acidimicrobiales bacterium]